MWRRRRSELDSQLASTTVHFPQHSGSRTAQVLPGYLITQDLDDNDRLLSPEEFAKSIDGGWKWGPGADAWNATKTESDDPHSRPGERGRVRSRRADPFCNSGHQCGPWMARRDRRDRSQPRLGAERPHVWRAPHLDEHGFRS